MQKRTEVIKKIAKAAKAKGMSFEKLWQGANHTIYSLDGLMIPVGRHNEFTNRYAEDVYRECEAKLGKRWWR
jgi:hypothetical protein